MPDHLDDSRSNTAHYDTPLRARETSNIFDPAVPGFDVARSGADTVVPTINPRARGESAPPDISTQTISEFADEVLALLPVPAEIRSHLGEDSLGQGPDAMSFDTDQWHSEVEVSGDTPTLLTPLAIGLMPLDAEHSMNEQLNARRLLIGDTHSEASIPSEDGVQGIDNASRSPEARQGSAHLAVDIAQRLADARSSTASVRTDNGDWGSQPDPLILLQHCVYLLNHRQITSEERRRRNQELLNAVIPLNEVFQDETPSEPAIYERVTRYMANMINELQRLPAEEPGTPFSEPSPSNPAAIEFLESLDTITLQALPEDHRSCSICQDPYVEDTSTGIQREEVVVIPNCGHTFGRDCITTWLDPHHDPPSNTCPLCRTVLFEMPRLQGEDFETLDQTMANDDETSGQVPAAENPSDTSHEWYPEAFLHAIAQAPLGPIDPPLRFTSTNDPPTPTTPGIYLISSQLLHLFRRFTRGTGPNRLLIAQALAREMGALVERLEDEIARMRSPRPWGVEGPSVEYLMDPAASGIVEIALERVREMEEIWAWSREGEGERRGEEDEGRVDGTGGEGE